MAVVRGQVMPLADQRIFFTLLCEQLGMDATPWRLEFFIEWARWEGTGAHFNPLATTRDGTLYAQDPHWNNFQGEDGRWYSVKNYANIGAGVHATARTLVNGYYPEVLAALTHQRISPFSVGPNLRTWGTTGFARLVEGGWVPSGTPASPAPDPVDEDHDRIRDILAMEFPELLGEHKGDVQEFIERFFVDHFRTYLDLAVNGDTNLEDGYAGWTRPDGTPLPLVKDKHLVEALHNLSEMDSDLVRRLHTIEEAAKTGAHVHGE